MNISEDQLHEDRLKNRWSPPLTHCLYIKFYSINYGEHHGDQWSRYCTSCRLTTRKHQAPPTHTQHTHTVHSHLSNWSRVCFGAKQTPFMCVRGIHVCAHNETRTMWAAPHTLMEFASTCFEANRYMWAHTRARTFWHLGAHCFGPVSRYNFCL